MGTSTSSFLLATILLAFLSYCSIADENNLLLTGEVLTTDSQLSNDAATFVIQDDCNLVLYTTGSGFQSNTHGQGLNCTLTLSDLGQLIIHRADGSIVWASTLAPNSTTGKYAAILNPGGQVAVYGASVWSAPFSSSSSNTTTFASGKLDSSQPTPIEARNVLFTDQILFKNGPKLISRDHSLVMREDCDLALERFSYPDTWDSGTKGKAQDCYARLSSRGQLVITDTSGNSLWSSSPISGKFGNYALVLQITGQVDIYGPIIWSTATF